MSDQLYIVLVLVVGIVVIIVPIIAISANQKKHKQQIEEERRAKILEHESTWGKSICESIISRKIGIDMTQEMVKLAWGQPSDIDQKEISKTGKSKERWVYGIPRRGANYVWFADGKVSKIKTP